MHDVSGQLKLFIGDGLGRNVSNHSWPARKKIQISLAKIILRILNNMRFE